MPSFAQSVAENSRTIANLSDADLEALMPALREAREVTARKMRAWLQRVDREDRYTTATHAQLISSLDRALQEIRTRIYHGAAVDLRDEGRDAGATAVRAMMRMARAGSRRFSDSSIPLRLDVARIVNSNSTNLLGRHARSAQRYAGRIGQDIKTTLAAGLASGESVGSIVSRLMRRPRYVSDRTPDAGAAEAIADTSFFRSRADAERLVRTENVHAANAATTSALQQENDDADTDNQDDTSGGEGGWLVRWDATFDKWTCEFCEDLDGEIREPGEEFLDGVFHPPAHPYCRCAVTPWREGWTL